MDKMIFEVGEKYQVKSNHQFHSNRIGIFEFLGGPDADCVVMSDPSKNDGRSKTMFAVGLNDCEKLQ